MPYLFDTSAARAVGSARLEVARSKGFELLLSPISFWELVCHLGSEPFARPRGNVLKGRLFTVLHDPLAELAADLGCPQLADRTRFDDREAVSSVLGALSQANSYEDLKAQEISIGGESRTIGDIAQNSQVVFNHEQTEFIGAQRRLCNALIQRYERPGAVALSGRDFVDEATGLARVLLKDMTALGCTPKFSAVALRTVLGCGYSVARACHYLASGAAVDRIVFDGNDLEDYYICIHLGVSSGRTLVTNDEGTLTAIHRTIESLQAHASSGGTTFITDVRLLSSAEFLAEVEAA